MTILVTGAAGFIGFSLCRHLLLQGRQIVGIDNLNNYYDVNLKKSRLALLERESSFTFLFLDITDRLAIEKLFSDHQVTMVIHLAAQVGVRYSVTNPHQYADVNLLGFLNVLEASRQHVIKHFVFASSSSVYGSGAAIPFSEQDKTDGPYSLYGATKKANELMAHSYANLYRLPCTALRFFTVYGPWGRPDMAIFSFTNNILSEAPITVYNNGNMLRDFTYVDDVIAGIAAIIDIAPHTHKDVTPYAVYNLGNSAPVQLKYFIELLEKNLEKKAKIHFQPMHRADVVDTFANVALLESVIGKLPHTPIEVGVARFVAWYRQYCNLQISPAHAKDNV